MKQGIHPDYKPATIVCSCGNRIETRSTQEEIHVEICSVCHPFYTGKQRLVDTAGRVERFQRKYGTVAERKKKAEEKALSDAGSEEAAGGKEKSVSAEAPTPEEPAAKAAAPAPSPIRTAEAEAGDVEPSAAGEEADAAAEEPDASAEEGTPEEAEVGAEAKGGADEK